jgi:hypothetical protein
MLYHTPVFRNKLLGYTGENAVANALKDIFHNIMFNNHNTSARPIMNALNISPGADSSGYALEKILDSLPTTLTTDCAMQFSDPDVVKTASPVEVIYTIVMTRFQDNFLDTLQSYNITKYPRVLLIDMSVSPNVSLKPPFELYIGDDVFNLIAAGIYVPGHYYAVCKVGEKWYIFNDRSVSLISDNIVNFIHSRQALVLAYERKSD